uniref:Uncharacterized protein n=1 Tax=Rhizophora mucronata TaxID=61149 RepID=A0A2P2IIP6_RHIMU
MRVDKVCPVSTMSSTRSTCLPRTSSFRSREMRGGPLDWVLEPYDSARTRSTEMGRRIRLTKSAKNKNAPVATPTTTRGAEMDPTSPIISDASSATRSEISDSVHSTFSMCESRDISQ